MNPCTHCTVLRGQKDEIEALKVAVRHANFNIEELRKKLEDYSSNASFTCSGRLDDGTLCLRRFNLATGEVILGWKDSSMPPEPIVESMFKDTEYGSVENIYRFAILTDRGWFCKDCFTRTINGGIILEDTSETSDE